MRRIPGGDLGGIRGWLRVLADPFLRVGRQQPAGRGRHCAAAGEKSQEYERRQPGPNELRALPSSRVHGPRGSKGSVRPSTSARGSQHISAASHPNVALAAPEADFRSAPGAATLKAVRAIGVDLREPAVRVVALERTGRELRLLGSEGGPAASDPGLATWLDAAARRLCGAEPDAVACSLPASAITHRILELPFLDPARLAAVVPYELEDALPSAPDEGVVASAVLSQNAGQSRVLAAFAQHEALREQIGQLAGARLDPAVINSGTLALVDLLKVPASGTVLVVTAGADGGLLLYRNGTLSAAHLLPDDDADGRRWAALALLGSFVGTERAQLTWLDVDATDPGVAGRFAAEIDASLLPIATLLPGWAAGLAPVDLRAAALAWRALDPSVSGLNFRSGAFAYHAPHEEARRQLRNTAAFAAAAALAGLIALIAGETTRGTELERLRTEIASATSKILPNAVPGTEVRRLRAAVESLAGRRDRLAGSGERAMIDVIASLGSAVPKGAPLQIDEITIDEESVRLHGRTDTYEAVDVAKRAFGALSGNREPEVRDVKASVDGRVEFRADIPLPAGGR